MEIWHGNTVLLSNYFLLDLVLLFANFLSISILISNVFNSASTALVTIDLGPAVNEVSEMPRINFAYAFSLAYLEWCNDIKSFFSVAYICCSYFKSIVTPNTY